MKTSEITHPLFREALEAIENGQLEPLQQLLESHPELVNLRANIPAEGYFKHPYLLWFIADNPIRNGTLPSNIVAITRLLITYVQKFAPESFLEQINYASGLVETGRIPRECGVQIELLELLFANGAKIGDAHGALANGNLEAAKYIIQRNGNMTLTAAACLDRMNEFLSLLPDASKEEKQVALIAASFFGRTEIIELLIKSEVDVNAYIKDGFHAHASALHQAVSSGSLSAVQALVNAGADLNAKDKIYHGTPLGWAHYMQSEDENENLKAKHAEIEQYLSNLLH